VQAPDGVFTPWAKKPGAPRKSQTEEIHQHWIALVKPSLNKQVLAKDFFGTDFTTARPEAWKRMIDLCRRAVERAEQDRPNFDRIKSEKKRRKTAD